MTWKRAGTMSSRSAPILADLHHVGAAAGTDLPRGLYHLFDARQMVGQMAKVALGWRASDFAIGIAFSQRGSRLGFRDGHFQILEGQLALVGGSCSTACHKARAARR